MPVFPVADVFIDSSVIIGTCYDFHSGDLERLKQYCKLGIIRLLTSEIVINEVKDNIRQDVNLFVSKLRNCIRERNPIREIGLISEKYKVLFEDFRSFGWAELVTAQWLNYLKETDCEIIPFCEVSLADLFLDYFSAKPPFELNQSKKSEFPDAVIAHSIKRYGKDTLTTIYVFTHDKGWQNSFPDDTISDSIDAPRKFIVVNSINEILQSIYKIAEVEEAKAILACLEDIKNSIAFLSAHDIEDVNIYVNGEANELLDLQFEYNEIHKITIMDIQSDFISFEEFSDDTVSLIFDVEYIFEVQYSYIDYENSIWDPEDEKYILLREHRAAADHQTSMSIQVILEKETGKGYKVKRLLYPYKLEISEETQRDFFLEEDDDKIFID